MLFGLNAGPVQRWLGGLAADLLRERLDTEVRVDRLEVGLFNRVTLRGVGLKDRAGRPLLEADMLSVKMELRPLARGEVSLRQVTLLDGQVRLYKERPDSAPNFQFVLDAFKGKETGKPSHLDLRINSLVLRRCRLNYDETYLPATPDRFNPSHLAVNGLDANVSLKRLTPDSLNLRVRSLRMSERSGWAVTDLSLRLAANRERMHVTNFRLSMPGGTRFGKDALSATYDGRSGGPRFWRTLVLGGTVDDALFATEDFVAFLPQLRGLRRTILIRTDFRVVPDFIRLRGLSVGDARGDLSLRAEVGLRRSDGRVVEAEADVARLHVGSALTGLLYSRLSRREAPAVLTTAGDVDFKGHVRYVRAGRSEMKGEWQTAAGHLETLVGWEGKRWEARVEGLDCRPEVLLPGKGLPQKADFTLEGRADFTRKGSPEMRACLRLDALAMSGHVYRDMRVDAKLADCRWTADLVSGDPGCDLTASVRGRLDRTRVSGLALQADVRNLAPSALGLTRLFGDARFAARVEAEAADLDFSRPEARLRLSGFSVRSSAGRYDVDSLSLSVAPSPKGTRLKLESDFATADLDGPLSLAALKDCALRMADAGLPGVLPAFRTARSADQWRFAMRLRDTGLARALFNAPLDLLGPLSIEGNLRADGGRTSVSVRTDGFRYGETEVGDLRLYLQGEEGRTSLLAQAVKRISRSNVKFVLEASAGDSTLRADVAWDDGGSHRYRGTVGTITEVDRSGGPRSFRTVMLPTEFSVNDSVWSVSSGSLVWGGRALAIDRFRLSHADQSLTLDGRLSASGGDSIVADLHKMDLSFLLGLIDFDAVRFAGAASGRVSLSSSLRHPEVEARLRVPDFRFNDALLGEADIRGRWNNEEKRIELDARMEEPGTGWTTVKGYVSPAHKRLDLHIGSENTNLAFLRKYVSGIFGELSGRVSGNCRLYGPFRQLDFEGREEGEASAEVLATGVRYRLSGGSIVIGPGRFSFNGMRVADEHGGRGTLDGNLEHEHLKNLRYDFRIGAENLMVYDRPQEMDMPFYATVYGTGTVAMKGRPGQFNADIRLRPERRTRFVYTLDAPDAFGDVRMLTFADAAAGDTLRGADREKEDAAARDAAADIRLNFTIDTNPNAALRIIMDEKAGDYIDVYGRGPIRATYYNKGDFHMYGTYTVDHGIYKMSIQDIIRKDFELKNGGRIVFAGDPYDGDLDLSAVYVVNSASLSDLNIGSSLSESSVRVNCILNFRGKVNAPEVSFDLDLPTVNEDEKQMVRSLINTEEEMNMQILYLLGVGRFYTYNYATTETAATQSQSSVAMKSFLANTISGQLNDIISNAIGSSNWTFGANLSTGSTGWSDMEVEGLLSGRLLNNRLLINGNFGYRDRPIYTSTNFVGDFDLRYLITPGGGVSLKAYSETNDRYFTKSSLTTQGVGIMLKRDFSNLKDLFTPHRKRKPLREGEPPPVE